MLLKFLRGLSLSASDTTADVSIVQPMHDGPPQNIPAMTSIMSVQERWIDTGINVRCTLSAQPLCTMTTPKISQIGDPIDLGELSQTAADVARYHDLISDR